MSTSHNGSTSALFVVRLSSPVTEKVTVAWQTEDGTAHAGIDYEAAAGTVEFAPGETEKGIEVVVLGREDGSTGNGLTFYVRLRPPVNAVLLDELSECRITVETDEGVVTTSLVVATGPHGKKGDPGLSAYELAKVQGYQGSLTDWLGGAGVQAVVMASQAAATAKEQLNRAFRFAPGNKVPELPPIEQMEGKIVVVRDGAPVGLEASNDSPIGLATNLAKNTGSTMIGHVDKVDGKNKTVRETLDRLVDQDKAQQDATKAASDALAAPNGFTQLGQVESFAALATVVPTAAGQQVMLRGWNKGTSIGGGLFKAVAGAANSDGGMTCAVNGNWHWERVIDADQINITHFGAVSDGKSDAIPAMLAMHAWSIKYAASLGLAGANAIGIVMPAGKFAISSMNLGENTEISAFKLQGPHVEMGILPKTTLVPMSLTTTVPAFTFRARRMEVRGFQWLATDSVQPFLINHVTRGSFVRIKSIVAQKIGARMFQVKDTLDTKIDQVYSYSGKAAFFRTSWSNENPGGWNHPTAIELSNFNFNGHTGEPAFDAIRAGQSFMSNGWFDHCECGFDISQGDWLLQKITQEGSKIGSKVKWCKIVQIDCRWAQGAGLDYDGSGYDPAWDLNGTPPPSVTNGFDQGGVDITPAGADFDTGVSTKFNWAKNTIENLTNADTWYVVGRLTMPRLGDSAIMRIVGAANWDSAQGDMIRPTGTGFGSGTSFIALEMKDPTNESTSRVEAHWWGEDNGPISDVRIAHTWQTITIYARMRQYARYGAVFLDTSGVPRSKTGNPTFFRPDLSAITDDALAAVPKLVQVPARKVWNKGQYDGPGFGMDFDNGDLLVYQRGQTIDHAQEWIPMMLNGNRRYIAVSDDTFAPRMVRYNRAEMATKSPATYVYRYVMVTDMGTGTGTQAGVVYSDGLRWVDMATNAVVSFS
ncbi:tail fiber protein [Erwinia phage Pavtok]|uniref:Putative EPS depolymerase n=1 Tax=Erwinia phage Pavtok TaxID=2267655 RepID=A0A345BLX3_9CAUD|nr:tail fiber protein [Erwinia phage Pavtok]AXF51444.1 putative EPS depolymerase [Erwinia phage Pavtok]